VTVKPPRCRSYAALALFFGLALLLGGAQRVSATAYMVIVDTGGHVLWGAGFLALGFVLWGAGRVSLRALQWALFAAAFSYLNVAAMFAIAAWQSPTANLTAPVAYGWIALAHLGAWERAREAREWS
jgi:hypothetical protein